MSCTHWWCCYNMPICSGCPYVCVCVCVWCQLMWRDTTAWCRSWTQCWRNVNTCSTPALTCLASHTLLPTRRSVMTSAPTSSQTSGKRLWRNRLVTRAVLVPCIFSDGQFVDSEVCLQTHIFIQLLTSPSN